MYNSRELIQFDVISVAPVLPDIPCGSLDPVHMKSFNRTVMIELLTTHRSLFSNTTRCCCC